MIEVVLLELDGVLADSTSPRRESLITALAAEGVALSEPEYDEHCAGLPVPAAAEAAMRLRATTPALPIDETVRDLVALRAEQHFLSLIGRGLSLTPGARDFLEHAASRVRLAMVTRATRREADVVLALADAAQLFECVITADDVISPKPSPAAYEHALVRLSRRRPARASVTVALEDSLAGVRAARAAGIACVAVGPVPPIVAAEADAHCSSVAGLTVPELQRVLMRDVEGVR
jgi:HAD superfamily hydrolase (TIGR01509 family)